MVGNIVIQPKPTEPAVCQVEMHLLAKARIDRFLLSLHAEIARWAMRNSYKSSFECFHKGLSYHLCGEPEQIHATYAAGFRDVNFHSLYEVTKLH